MTSIHTWESLRELTLVRQFPAVAGLDEAAVLDLAGRVGPVQAQAARAPFLTVSSRLPGATNQAVSAAYESYGLVRTTSLRGTVHTSLRSLHAWLDALARRTSMNLWCRTLSMSPADVSRLRERIEAIAGDDWVPQSDLYAQAVAWLADEGFGAAVEASRAGPGLAFFRGYSALLRRPLTGGWHQQGRYGYRTAASVLGDPVADADDATTQLVRAHLAAFGPATRRDIAWWSGDGLRRVDAAVQRLGDEVVSVPGPGGLDFLDLAAPPGDGSGHPGVRLLPEYDGLLLGYAPTGRTRFADQEVIAFSWNRANGVHAPTVLVDGKLRGKWGLATEGRATRLVVTMLPGERVPAEGDIADQAAAVAAALAIELDGVEVTAAAE